MTIAIFNECFLTEEHIKRLEVFGNVKQYTATTKQEALERIQDVDVAIVDGFLTPLDNDVLFQANP